jgi:hypothetical protein
MCGAAAYLGAHRLTVELRFMHRAFSTARELTVNPQLAVRQSNFHESGVVVRRKLLWVLLSAP